MPKKILIVDDEPDVLKVVAFRMNKLDCEIYTAIDGQDAWEKAKQIKPDLILLDLRLPLLDGTEVCRRVKADAELSHIPVILLSASADVLVEKVNLCNADTYLLKPFNAEELLNTVKKFLSI
jgi:two-component system alkaline phosphatase synthesis response regulator PhoP